jgi:hypothetical protein
LPPKLTNGGHDGQCLTLGIRKGGVEPVKFLVELVRHS